MDSQEDFQRIGQPTPEATAASLAATKESNRRLAATLRDARDQIVSLREELNRLAEPPNTYGVFLELVDEGVADVVVSGVSTGWS